MQLRPLTLATAAASMGLADYDLRRRPGSLSVSRSTGLSQLQLPWWPTKTPAANLPPSTGTEEAAPSAAAREPSTWAGQ